MTDQLTQLHLEGGCYIIVCVCCLECMFLSIYCAVLELSQVNKPVRLFSLVGLALDMVD